MDFNAINKVARMDDFLPTKKIVELEHNKNYQITAFKIANTKFGLKLIVALDGAFMIFLPARISIVPFENTDQLQLYKNAAAENQLYLRFLGGPTNANLYRM